MKIKQVNNKYSNCFQTRCIINYDQTNEFAVKFFFNLIIIMCLIFLPNTESFASGLYGTKEDSLHNQCFEAMKGDFNIKLGDYSDPLHNAYLIRCAVTVYIPEPVSSQQEELATEKKRKLADFLLSKNFDVKYVNESGNTLLMSVIISYMPDDWKVKTAKQLIEKGVDVNRQNNFGNTAIDLAKHRKNNNILKLLSKYEK